MARYGIKLNTGKVMWVTADSAEVRDGAIIFFGQPKGGSRGVVAAFPLGSVDHFGLPEVLESHQSVLASGHTGPVAVSGVSQSASSDIKS